MPRWLSAPSGRTTPRHKQLAYFWQTRLPAPKHATQRKAVAPHPAPLAGGKSPQGRKQGIDAVTLGDHVYRDQRILPQLEDAAVPIARPANLSHHAAGTSLLRIPVPDGGTLWMFTLLGRIFMNLPADDPFACADRLLESIPEKDPMVVVEVHMEATSEKVALAHHLDGRVAAVLGTHTHVPTADARVLSSA